MTHSMLLPAVAAALLALAAPSSSAGGDGADEPLAVTVELRVELVSTIARLAGFDEYNEELARSPYSAAVDERFRAFADHAAVRKARALRRSPGLSHEALATLALHLEPGSLEERFDFLEHPGRLRERWQPADARAFARLVRAFARDTDFAAFFREQAPLYRQCEQRLSAATAADLKLEWFDATLGVKPGVRFRLIPALLIGGHNYGVGVTLPDGTEELSPCIGAWSWDGEGVPLYGDDLGWVVPHEFAHSYVNPLIAAHMDALAPFEDALFRPIEALMQAQAYGTWQIVLCEALTRASVLRYLHATDGRSAARKQAAYEVGQGFAWVPDLAVLLDEYEQARERYPTLADFMPRIVAFVGDRARRAAQLDAQRPRLVSIAPAEGDTDVAPGKHALVLSFDRPMRRGSYSMLLLDGVAFPPVTGAIAYDAAAQVLTVPVTLEPETRYGFQLNSATKTGFASREGVPLAPVRVEFATGARR